MASVVKIKRSSVTGKSPNTSNITTGELALNLRDGKLFSSNGTNVFEVGANLASLNVTGEAIVQSANVETLVVGVGSIQVGSGSNNFTLPAGDGANNQVLVTDGNGTVTWQNQSGSGGGTANAEFIGFQYTASNNQTVFTGADNANSVLDINANSVVVFQNGIKLVGGIDFTPTSSSVVTLTAGAAANDSIEILTIKTVQNYVDVNAKITSNSELSVTNAAPVVVDSFGTLDYRTAKYLVQIKNNDNSSEYHATEVLLIHDGSSVYHTEYGTIYSNNSLASIETDINGSLVRLKVSTTVANTNVRVLRTAVTD